MYHNFIQGNGASPVAVTSWRVSVKLHTVCLSLSLRENAGENGSGHVSVNRNLAFDRTFENHVERSAR